jgi:Fe-S-cluster containining protein
MGMSSKDPSICAACHAKGRGCCILQDKDTAEMFGLTQTEIEAIAQASGKRPQEFVVADQVSPGFLAGVAAIHPLLAQTMPQGRRLRLRVDEQGACFFLGPGGCVLPTEARPLYCRLYPFWFTPDDRLMVLLSDTCLAQEGAGSWQEVLERMAGDEASLRDLFVRLLEYAGQNPENLR